MNHTDLAPIVQQATRHTKADRSWCLLHPGQVLDLANELEGTIERLDKIAALYPAVIIALQDHDLARVMEVLRVIERLSKPVP